MGATAPGKLPVPGFMIVVMKLPVPEQQAFLSYEGVYKSFRTESITIYTSTFDTTRCDATQEGYGGKTHWTDSKNSDTTAPSGRELCYLQFSLQAASPETF
jgi:hypothetical protein